MTEARYVPAAGFRALTRLNRRLVYCAISGFGESGPESARAGYDLVVQAESGIMDITGFEDGPPVKVGTSIADLVAGMSAAHGVTLALLAQVIFSKGPIGYDKWAGIFSAQWMKVLTFSVIVAIAWHAWVGLREVLMDYIKPVGLRLALQVFSIVWLVSCAGWGIQVLWRL